MRQGCRGKGKISPEFPNAVFPQIDEFTLQIIESHMDFFFFPLNKRGRREVGETLLPRVPSISQGVC